MQTLRRSLPQRFQPALLASLIAVALAPHETMALDLATRPARGPVSAANTGYVVPNVIFSLDNSVFTKNQTISINGNNRSATAVMTDMLINAIQDKNTFPDGSFRFTWQTMTNGCQSDAALGTMLELNQSNRDSFIEYLRRFDSCSWRTTSQRIPANAYQYMASPLTPDSPWAYKPGTQGAPYLGCRRNYHFILSGNAYEEARNSSEKDDVINSWSLATAAAGPWRFPDGKAYLSFRLQQDNPQSADQYRAYTSNDANAVMGNFGSISNIAMTGWFPIQYFSPRYDRSTITKSPVNDTAIASPFFSRLAFPPQVLLEGELPLPASYLNAPDTETLHNRVSGNSVTLEKYWNPRYNPAIWPHMVTHTFGLGDKAVPRNAYTSSTMHYRGWRRDAVQPTQSSPYGLDGDFVEYAKGIYGWRAKDSQYDSNQTFADIGSEEGVRFPSSVAADSAQDLWRAAFVSRGNYYVVQRGNEVADALRTVTAQSEADFGGKPSGASSNATAKAGTAGTGLSAVFSGATTSGETAIHGPVRLFKSYYHEGEAWKGWITGETLSAHASTTAVTAGISGWQGKTTAQRVDRVEPQRRIILGWRDANGDYAAGGVAFRWASNGKYLSPAHNAQLAGANDRGEARLNYVRGDRSAEGAAGTAFRQRQSAHGDIVNSQIWYTAAPASNHRLPGYAAYYAARSGRTPMLYVGANDGMLHGFSALDGTEAFAYVPRGVVPQLASLTAQGYNDAHRYLVDGSPMTGDVQLAAGNAAADWRTVLVGTLGAGGKGYFVLDVTDPGSVSDQETTAASVVVMDKTLAESEVPACVSANTSCLAVPEADLGYITATPVRDDSNPLSATQITRMNDNRWAVVLGNGYNSANQRPVLLVQYLDGDKTLLRIPATGSTATRASANTSDNGLSAPRLVDVDSDGRPDVAYAGDNKGNLWKFDLTSRDAAQWGVAFGGVPLYTAVGPSTAHIGGGVRTQAQPISTAPIVRANDRTLTIGRFLTEAVGGMMVVFATGRNVSRTDPADLSVQSVYGVLDNTRYSYTGTGDNRRLTVQAACDNCNDGKRVQAAAPLGSGVFSLARQSIGSKPVGGQSGRGFWAVEQSSEAGTPSVNWLTQKGWYLDLPVQGERVIKNIELYDSTNVLAVYSQAPLFLLQKVCTREAVETAGAAERQFITLINAVDGAAPRVPLVDANGDGIYNAKDSGAARIEGRSGPVVSIFTGPNERTHVHSDGSVDKLARPPTVILRPSWRHLQ